MVLSTLVRLSCMFMLKIMLEKGVLKGVTNDHAAQIENHVVTCIIA